MRGLMLIVALAAVPARAEEARLDGEAVAAAVSGQILAYEDGTLQVFGADDETIFDFRTQSLGHWEVRGNRYCAAWPPAEAWACYEVTAGGDGRSIAFIAPDGSTRTGQYVRR